MTYEDMTRAIKDSGVLVFNRIEAREDGVAIVFSDPATEPPVSVGKTIVITGVAEEDVTLIDEG